MEGNTSEPAKSLEGKIVTTRGLKKYAKFLHFEPTLLKDQKVLNFGSGGSNIGKELEGKQIPCSVTDVDLQVTGTGHFFAGLKFAEKFFGINEESRLGKKLSNIHEQASHKNGRNFMQADGRSLPFADKTFDTVLALYSTYQIPDEDKNKVFGELIRVANVIHCGPITQKDFDVIRDLCQEANFDIVICRPFSERGVFTIATLGEYESYKEKYSEEERIKIPKIDSPKVTNLFGKPILARVSPGNYIVLKRKPK